MMRVLRRRLLVSLGFALVGCLSPTLPLPPPSQPDVSVPDAAGFVRLQGIAAPRAEVFAYNHNNGLIAGQVTGADSHFDFVIKAEVNDRIELWYAKGTDESQSVVFNVPTSAQ